MAFQIPIIDETANDPKPLIVTPEEHRAQEAKKAARIATLEKVNESRQEESLAKNLAGNMQRWHADPWAMIQDGVIYTLDETNFERPVGKFPPHPWLEQIVREWEANKLLAIPKSRRMMISWLMIYLHLWLAMWHPGISVFFVSDSEKKSADLIKKALFIYRHIPENVMLKPKIKDKHCLIEFPGLDSYMMGVPEGEDQLRGYTASALVFDEWAFWERPMESLAAAKPSITGGGRLTIVSTPGQECFYDICFDQRM